LLKKKDAIEGRREMMERVKSQRGGHRPNPMGILSKKKRQKSTRALRIQCETMQRETKKYRRKKDRKISKFNRHHKSKQVVVTQSLTNSTSKVARNS
jgi:thiamine biosynthesis lipoprotein ApbE